MLAGLAPLEPEVHGLLALMELQASRLHARTDHDGRPVLLDDQDRATWDALLIRRGLASLDRAMAAAATGRPVGPYVVQAQIAACHARAHTAEETDWTAIAGWYDVLARLGDNPVVEVNRAVAHGRAHGPDAGLAVLDAVTDHPALAGSHLVPSVRGDLLERAGRLAEAADAFTAAAALTGNGRGAHAPARPGRAGPLAPLRRTLHRLTGGPFRSESRRATVVSTRSRDDRPRRPVMTITGEPCWIHLFTTDVDTAVSFYGGLFGWSVGEPSEEYGGYRMFLRDDEPVAGLMPNDTSEPDVWEVFLQTPDIAADRRAGPGPRRGDRDRGDGRWPASGR